MTSGRKAWRLHPASWMVGRIALAFARFPDVDRVVVVVHGTGARVVPFGEEGGAQVLGTYTRDVPITAVLEDFA